MRINHNISALQTNAHMRKTDKALDKAMQRLSSGYKINKASDDAAGMAISRKMRTQIDGLERASMNGSDGISVIQTAEGALNEVTSILQRCRELAVQGANDTLSQDDRAAIQKEINQLMDEIQRITDSTEFNTKTLLNGDLDNNMYTNTNGVEMIYCSDTVSPDDYKITVTQDPRQAVINCNGPSLNTVAAGDVGTVTINGVTVSFNEGDTRDDWFDSLRNTCDILGINVFYGSGTPSTQIRNDDKYAGYKDEEIGTGNLIFVSKGYGSSQKIEIGCDNAALAGKLGLLTDPTKTVTATGVDAEIDKNFGNNDGFNKSATTSSDGNIVTIKDSNGFEIRYKIAPGVTGTNFTDKTGTNGANSATGGTNKPVDSSLLAAGSLFLQVGANENQTMEVKIPRIDPEILGITNANVMTHETADKAITMFDNAISFVSLVRAELGAYQNRLEHTIADLDTTGLNLTEAMSRLMDADMATEITNSTQQNVLQQAGTAMLAQANERPQTILSLLNG